MRDRKRIPRITTLLQKIWEHQPDLRYNQLISNLQALYSQQNDHYGKRKFDLQDKNFKREAYVDLFFLEDDRWEMFLENYWGKIEAELKKREDDITDDVIKEVIELFLEAGIEQKNLDENVCNKIRRFYAVESRRLEIEVITNVIRNFSKDNRQELFHKINKSLC